MIRSRSLLVLTAVQLALLLGLWGWGARTARLRVRRDLSAERALVEKLQLTDLALWTEARYTRHPSQADFFSPFQDFPSALDHFPAGSILGPPPRPAFDRVAGPGRP